MLGGTEEAQWGGRQMVRCCGVGHDGSVQGAMGSWWQRGWEGLGLWQDEVGLSMGICEIMGDSAARGAFEMARAMHKEH